VPTYLTRSGAAKLVDELRRLSELERPKVVQEVTEAAAQGDRSENAEYIYGKKRLREIDRRIRFLSKRLDSAEIVEGGEDRGEVVYFGAQVELVDEDGGKRVYLLVGPDEADPERGKISFQSPIGKALLKRKVGDTVRVLRPAGEIEFQIVRVHYSD